MAYQPKKQGMFNDKDECVDLYIPRRCDYTNKLLNSKDKSSVQINIAVVDENGKATDKVERVVISGYLRAKGQGASALESILRQRNVLPIQ